MRRPTVVAAAARPLSQAESTGQTGAGRWTSTATTEVERRGAYTRPVGLGSRPAQVVTRAVIAEPAHLRSSRYLIVVLALDEDR